MLALITGPMIEPFVYWAFCIFRAMKNEKFNTLWQWLKSSIIALATLLILSTSVSAQLRLGIAKHEVYLPLLEGQSVAVVANQTSVKGDAHLVDFLLGKSVNLKKVFSPEHGFRGTASAGEQVKDGKDQKTGLPITSLYGKNKKPSPDMLAGIDVVIFDIQDVGTRFYTYISTMSLVMEACAENNVQVLVFDRPNPNGHFVDGPVLEAGFESFVGMHHVPIVHGMTVGEYAKMVNGEGWLEAGVKCDLTVIPMDGYDHRMAYSVPIAPSPNLPNDEAIRLYPSLCLFEGTNMSIGRGTDKPFQQMGAPYLQQSFGYSFTPVPNAGAKHPKYNGERCYGVDLTNFANGFLARYNQIYLFWLIEAYKLAPDPDAFFNSFFEKLAGTDRLRQQIVDGLPEEEIRASWQEDLVAFKQIRRQYLLYPDFE